MLFPTPGMVSPAFVSQAAISVPIHVNHLTRRNLTSAIAFFVHRLYHTLPFAEHLYSVPRFPAPPYPVSVSCLCRQRMCNLSTPSIIHPTASVSAIHEPGAVSLVGHTLSFCLDKYFSCYACFDVTPRYACSTSHRESDAHMGFMQQFFAHAQASASSRCGSLTVPRSELSSVSAG